MINVIDLHFQGQSHATAAFLVSTGEGAVLIETGPDATWPQLSKGIQEAGFTPEMIRKVFLTHIHLDHAGAAWRFAEMGAKIYVHPFGERHLASPEKLMNSARRIYGDDMDQMWGKMLPIAPAQLAIVNHGEQVMLDATTALTAWHTPGHAVHHIAWQLGENVFTGDVGGVKIEGGLVVPPCPPPDIQLEDWLASLRLLRGLDAKRFYLTHFGAIEDPAAHVNQLEQRLINWAEWMRPYYESESSVSDVTPAFQEMVKEELVAAGIPADGIARYETANPSWMSVAGLLRYWQKKLEDMA